MKVNVVDNSKIVNSNSVDKINFKQLNNEFKLSNHQLTSEQQQQIILQAQQTIQQQKQNKVIFIPNDYAWMKHLFAGALAGVASRTCTAPLDRIKVLLQVKTSEVQSITSCYKFIKEEGGYRAFWRGNGINCIKIAPEIALRFMFYEQVR